MKDKWALKYKQISCFFATNLPLLCIFFFSQISLCQMFTWFHFSCASRLQCTQSHVYSCRQLKTNWSVLKVKMARSLNQATKAGFALHSGGGGDAAAVKNDPLWQRAWKKSRSNAVSTSTTLSIFHCSRNLWYTWWNCCLKMMSRNKWKTCLCCRLL